MKLKTFFLAALLMMIAIPAFAAVPQTVTMICEGAVGLPVSLLKLVGGSLKLIGEVLIFPFALH